MEDSVESAVEGETQNPYHYIAEQFDTIVATKQAEIKQEIDDRRHQLYENCKPLLLDKIIPWWKKRVQEGLTEMSQNINLRIVFRPYYGPLIIDIKCMHESHQIKTEWVTSDVSIDDLVNVMKTFFNNIGFSCREYRDKNELEVSRKNKL